MRRHREVQGYEDDGILGALNAVNPLYHAGRNAADAALAIDRGDYRAAAAAGTKAVLVAVVAVVGAGKGIGALAEESAVAGRAAGRAGGAGRYVYQLVDDVGDPVYYGISNNPLRRLGEHAVDAPGPFREM